MLLILTGCGNKTAIDTNKFKSIVENHNLVTSSALAQFSEYNYVKEATIAQSSDNWQIEFYVLDSVENAISMFNTNKAKFENSKGSVNSESSVSLGNNSSYTLNSNGYYMHICRVDNTMIYAKVSDNNSKAAKDLITELGY